METDRQEEASGNPTRHRRTSPCRTNLEKVFAALLRACETDGAVLATVAEASGSAPRGAGACMAVGQQGRLAGTVGGGSLELAATGQARAHLLERKNGLSSFDLGSAAGDLGMICGGSTEILYTYLPPAEETLHVLSLIEACLNTQSAGRLVLPFTAGIGFIDAEGRTFGLQGLQADAFPDGPETAEIWGERYFIRPLTPSFSVILVGAGHVSQALSRLLPWLDFPYRVVDDRPEYADPALFPGALSVCMLPYTEEGLGQLEVGPNDCIVILTDGHRGDYAAEKWALSTPAAYVGVIGSARKTACVRSLLEQDGYAASQLDQVSAPIGLPIGSDTPAEIAVSIAAELIEKRSQGRKKG